MSDTKNLTDSQRKLIYELFDEPVTLKTAALRCGVPRLRLLNWMQQPQFRELVEAAVQMQRVERQQADSFAGSDAGGRKASPRRGRPLRGPNGRILKPTEAEAAAEADAIGDGGAAGRADGPGERDVADEAALCGATGPALRLGTTSRSRMAELVRKAEGER